MIVRKSSLLLAFVLITSLSVLRVSAQDDQSKEEGSTLFGEAGQKVVIENDNPAMKFISRTGSVAYIYFRKHEDEDAFAVNVADWDNYKIKTGWLYFTRNNVVFESDDDKKRSFTIPRAEVKKVKGQKTWNGMNFLVIKVKGKEKRFMVIFMPVPASRTGIWGAHQKPVFEFLENLVSNYDEVEQEFKQSATKLSTKPIIASNQTTTNNEGQPSKEDKAIIDVTSEPAGAEIYVDGVFNSSTPSKLQLPLGEHSIKITRPSYKDWERKIVIEAGSSKALNAILEKQ